MAVARQMHQTHDAQSDWIRGNFFHRGYRHNKQATHLPTRCARRSTMAAAPGGVHVQVSFLQFATLIGVGSSDDAHAKAGNPALHEAKVKISIFPILTL